MALRPPPNDLDAALHAEYGQTGQVRGGGQQVEIGADFDGAADPSSAATVSAAHEVGELSLHLGARGAVVVLPLGVVLASAGPGERFFVGTDADGASPGNVVHSGASHRWYRRL